jgi:hypothetical protein
MLSGDHAAVERNTQRPFQENAAEKRVPLSVLCVEK